MVYLHVPHSNIVVNFLIHDLCIIPKYTPNLNLDNLGLHGHMVWLANSGGGILEKKIETTLLLQGLGLGFSSGQTERRPFLTPWPP